MHSHRPLDNMFKCCLHSVLSVFRFDFQNVKYIKRAFALGLVAIWWHNQPQRVAAARGGKQIERVV